MKYSLSARIKRQKKSMTVEIMAVITWIKDKKGNRAGRYGVMTKRSIMPAERKSSRVSFFVEKYCPAFIRINRSEKKK